jgi:hypothetical protein
MLQMISLVNALTLSAKHTTSLKRFLRRKRGDIPLYLMSVHTRQTSREEAGELEILVFPSLG